MTLMEGLLFLSNVGVFGMGAGVLKWAMSIDRRVTRIEALQSVK